MILIRLFKPGFYEWFYTRGERLTYDDVVNRLAEILEQV